MADFILSVQAQPLVQLPGGHGAGKAQGPAHRNRDAAGERKADQQAHDQSRGADRINQRNGIADFIIGGADGRGLQSVAGSGDALGGADAFVAGLVALHVKFVDAFPDLQRFGLGVPVFLNMAAQGIQELSQVGVPDPGQQFVHLREQCGEEDRQIVLGVIPIVFRQAAQHPDTQIVDGVHDALAVLDQRQGSGGFRAVLVRHELVEHRVHPLHIVLRFVQQLRAGFIHMIAQGHQLVLGRMRFQQRFFQAFEGRSSGSGFARIGDDGIGLEVCRQFGQALVGLFKQAPHVVPGFGLAVLVGEHLAGNGGHLLIQAVGKLLQGRERHFDIGGFFVHGFHDAQRHGADDRGQQQHKTDARGHFLPDFQIFHMTRPLPPPEVFVRFTTETVLTVAPRLSFFSGFVVA